MQIEYGLPKSKVEPEANYSPWLSDASFLEAYAEVHTYTAVDVFRHYELWKLAQQIAHVPGDLLEVGVWKGSTGILLALAARKFLKNRRVHLCDTFEGIVKAGDNDPFYKGGEFSDTSLDAVRDRVQANSLTNVSLHQGIFPEQTGSSISTRYLSLVHIDVDVYASARETFWWVWPRMSVGGIVVFDDYGWVDCAGVIKFVEDEVFGRADGLMIHNLNGHAVMVKTGSPQAGPVQNTVRAVLRTFGL